MDTSASARATLYEQLKRCDLEQALLAEEIAILQKRSREIDEESERIVEAVAKLNEVESYFSKNQDSTELDEIPLNSAFFSLAD